MDVNNCCKNDNAYDRNMSGYTYRVQIGLFRVYNNALNLQMRLYEEGYMADIKKRGDLYALTVGDFSDMNDAVVLERRLRSLGYNTLLIAE